MARVSMHRSACGGFSLVEVLVTIFFIGVLVSALAVVISFTALTRDAKYEDIALHIAAKKLQTIRASGYSNATSSSTFSDPLLSSLPNARASTTIASFNASTKQVTVSVTWWGRGKFRSESLTTLLTQVGGL